MGDFWEHLLLASHIETFRGYLDVVEDFLLARQQEIAEESKDLESRRQTLLKRIRNGERLDEEWEQLRNDYQRIEVEESFWNGVIRRVRNSFFVTLYTFYEKNLREICRSKRPDYVNLSVDDMAGRSITEKVEAYWEKVLGLKFPRNSYWGDIHQGYRRLRNCIVHNDGVLDDNLSADDRRHLERFIQGKEYRGLLLVSDGIILLQKDFCYKVLDTIESFFHTLIDSVETAQPAHSADRPSAASRPPACG